METDRAKRTAMTFSRDHRADASGLAETVDALLIRLKTSISADGVMRALGELRRKRGTERPG